jgi:hypothetical protein
MPSSHACETYTASQNDDKHGNYVTRDRSQRRGAATQVEDGAKARAHHHKSCDAAATAPYAHAFRVQRAAANKVRNHVAEIRTAHAAAGWRLPRIRSVAQSASWASLRKGTILHVNIPTAERNATIALLQTADETCALATALPGCRAARKC